jgi:hypothetical protein
MKFDKLTEAYLKVVNEEDTQYGILHNVKRVTLQPFLEEVAIIHNVNYMSMETIEESGALDNYPGAYLYIDSAESGKNGAVVCNVRHLDAIKSIIDKATARS